MKEYLSTYRPFLQFLGVFLLSYLILILLYQWYLGQFDTVHFEVDGFTKLVAQQAKCILERFDYSVVLSPYPDDPSVLVAVDHVPIVRIIEGCNAISVMILFAAFILAFSKGFIKTALFVILGVLLIHILNIARIVLLIIGIIKLPAYEHVLHGVVFPLVIYGTVFFLWIIWVTKFAKNATKTT